MNLDATPDTVRAIVQVFKLAGILDDRAPQPDKARIAAWAEQAQRHNLVESDLIGAVHDFYDQPHDQPVGIGYLIAAGRSRKRDRLDRESKDALEARQGATDERLGLSIAALAEKLSVPKLDGSEPYRRPIANVLVVPCPHCRAPVGKRCTNSARGGAQRHEAHPCRVDAANEHNARHASKGAE